MLIDNFDNLANKIDKELVTSAIPVSKTKKAIIRATLGINPCLTKKELDELEQSDINEG